MLCFAERSAHSPNSANSEVDGNEAEQEAVPALSVTSQRAALSGLTRFTLGRVQNTALTCLFTQSSPLSSTSSRCHGRVRAQNRGAFPHVGAGCQGSDCQAGVLRSGKVSAPPTTRRIQTRTAVYHSCAMLIGRNRKPQPAAARRRGCAPEGSFM